MSVVARPHATFFLDPLAAAPIETLRSRWDPVMASQIAAHFTAIYPEELDDVETLLPRVLGAAARTAPFRITIGPAFYDRSPELGVFLHLNDPTGGVATFRSHAGLVSGGRSDFPLHVTIAHPRTSTLGPQAWSDLEAAQINGEFLITDVSVTAFDGTRWQTTSSHPLVG